MITKTDYYHPSMAIGVDFFAAHILGHATDLVPEAVKDLLSTTTGTALLCLLANATAKEQPTRQGAKIYYQIKAVLLGRAIKLAEDQWWATPHTFGEYADTVVFIQTPFARFAFHCRRNDPILGHLLANAPTRAEGWQGGTMQPYAKALIWGYLAGTPTAQEVIEHLQTQEKESG